MTARSGFCSNFAFCFPSCGTGNGRFRVVVLFEPWMFAFNCPRRPSNYRFALLLRPMFPLPTALILSKAGGCCSFTTRCSAEELPASIFEGGWQEPLVSFNFTRRHSVSVRQHACAPPCFYMRLTCLSTTRQLNNVHPPASSLRTVSGLCSEPDGCEEFVKCTELQSADGQPFSELGTTAQQAPRSSKHSASM